MRAFLWALFLHRPVILVCTVDEECNPPHNLDLLRSFALDRLAIITNQRSAHDPGKLRAAARQNQQNLILYQPGARLDDRKARRGFEDAAVHADPADTLRS